MMRFLKIALPVFVVGFLAGNAFWYLFSPLWIDQVVSEALPDELMVSVISLGAFQDADRAHQGAGNALLLQTATGSHLMRFTEFEVTNGPDLEVWLVADDTPFSSGAVLASEWVSLGQLKGNIGDQTYTIPDDVDVSQFGSVVIWCEQFSVLFSVATLEEPS
ncbi:DM13 domain-containing protein [Ahrensia marina]|uniref:DM13 domain-containing protein n=1 Tax=Ahrensia marina TaxID=1514904 RepID=UPI0035CF39AE